MRVIRNDKFLPIVTEGGDLYHYRSQVAVEVEGVVFNAERCMTVEEYESTYPALRDFIHDALRTDIMTQIRKKLFEGVV